MLHRQQIVEDLATIERRITDGEGYIERMGALVERKVERSGDTPDMRAFIAEMQGTLQDVHRQLVASSTGPVPP